MSTEDCFTASEQGIVTDSTHFGHQHYEEGVSFEEFIGTPREDVRPRRFNSIPPKLTYYTESDSYAKPPKLKGRSLSVDSGSVTSVSPRGSTYSSPQAARGSGVPKGRGMAAPGGVVAPGSKVDVLELPISSNPMIVENTGFKGDSQLPLLVAALHDITAGGETESENGIDTQESSLHNGDELENEITEHTSENGDVNCKGDSSKDCHSEHAQTEEHNLPTGPIAPHLLKSDCNIHTGRDESVNLSEGTCNGGGFSTTHPKEGSVTA